MSDVHWHLEVYDPDVDDAPPGIEDEVCDGVDNETGKDDADG